MARRALIVANAETDIQKGLPELPGVAPLVRELGSVLADPEIGGYELEVVLNATSQVTKRRISRLFEKAGPDDTVLLYLLTHGMTDERGVLHFGAADTPLPIPMSNTIPAEFVEEALDAGSCRSAVVLLDCSYAGLFKPPRDPGPDRSVLVIAGVNGLARTRRETFGIRNPDGFPLAVIEGLRTGDADVDLDGVVSGDDLSRYLVTHGGSGGPVSKSVGPIERLVVAHNPVPIPEAGGNLVAAGKEVDESVVAEPDADVEWTSDSPAQEDLLHRRDLAGLLADRMIEIQRERPDSSFLVHLDGAWGTGKSTLLNFMRPQLEKAFLLVEFDAWRQARLAHPWWTLLTAARDEIAADLGWWRARMLRVSEVFDRVRRTGAQYVFALAVLVLFTGALAVWLWPRQGTATGWTEAAKVSTAILAAAVPLWTGSLIASRYLLWNSARGARLFEQSGTNPMSEVSEHFAWLLGRSKKPVVFLVDDLDRCGQDQVVDLLDTVQTLFRDKSRQAPFFVVAADGAWLRRSYEAKYRTFDECVAQPGKPLGYLFLDKLFQLSVPMPLVTEAVRELYVDKLLEVVDVADARVEAEVGTLRDRLASDRGQEREILEILEKSSAEAKAAVVGDAARALYHPGTRARTEHALRKFAPLLGDNPRGLKLFVNTYSVFRAIRTLEGNTVATDTLALWCIVRVRWPDLFDHLQANPASAAGILDPILAGDHFPERLREVAASASVREVVASAMGGPLHRGRIEQCCGGSGNPRDS